MESSGDGPALLRRDEVTVVETWDLSAIYKDSAARDVKAARVSELAAMVSAHRDGLARRQRTSSTRSISGRYPARRSV